MPGKIFVRERRDVGESEGRPRFAVVGAQGDGLRFFRTHVRKAELEAIAHATGADFVYLPKGAGEHHHQPSGEGHRRSRRRRGAGGTVTST